MAVTRILAVWPRIRGFPSDAMVVMLLMHTMMQRVCGDDCGTLVPSHLAARDGHPSLIKDPRIGGRALSEWMEWREAT